MASIGSTLRAGRFRQSHQHRAKFGGCRDTLGEFEPQRRPAGLQIDAVGIATAAAPVCAFGTKQTRRIKIHGLPMIFIHVNDRALLGFEQLCGVADLSQELQGLEIDDPAKSRNQVDSRKTDQKKGKILEIDEGLG